MILVDKNILQQALDDFLEITQEFYVAPYVREELYEREIDFQPKLKFIENMANYCEAGFTVNFQYVLNNSSLWSLYNGKGLGDVGLVASVMCLPDFQRLFFEGYPNVLVISNDVGIKSHFFNNKNDYPVEVMNWDEFKNSSLVVRKLP